MATRSVTGQPDVPASPRAIVVHGYRASPDKHWFPWLKAQLEDHGVATSVLTLPHPTRPAPEPWTRAVATALGKAHPCTVLVGHSLGCLAILRALAAAPTPWTLGGLVLVAPFREPLTAVPELDQFAAGGVELDHIIGLVARRHVVRSDNDDVVPPPASDRIAATLSAEVTVVAGAGHFLDTQGYTALPAVRDHVLAALARTQCR